MDMDTYGLDENEGGQMHTFPGELDGLLCLIADDGRPTFLADKDTVAYRNPAFTRLLRQQHADESAFQSWVHSQHLSNSTSSTDLPKSFCGHTWTVKSVDRKGDWLAVYCTWQAKGENDFGRVYNGSSEVKQERDYSYEGDKLSEWYVDWFRFPPDRPHPNSWVQFMRQHDFGKTAIGPIPSWPPFLRSVIVSLFACPDPRLLLWGDDLLMLYNEAAIPVMSENSIAALGNPMTDIFGQQPHDIDITMLRDALKKGISTTNEDVEIVGVRRDHQVEEGYFNCHTLPIVSPDGHVTGMLVEFCETTYSVFERRRVNLSHAIMDKLSHIQDITSFWTPVINGFASQTDYIVYSLAFVPNETNSQPKSFRLKASSNFQASALPSPLFCGDPNSSLADVLANAMRSQEPVILHSEDGTLPAELAVSMPVRGRVSTVCLLPVPACDKAQPVVCLAMALNPRKCLDNMDTLWIKYIQNLMSQSFQFLSLPETDRTVDGLESLNQSLRQELRLTALKAEKSEDTFTRLAKNAPFGMYMFQPQLQGRMSYANEAFARLLGFSDQEQLRKHAEAGDFWRNIVDEDDYESTKNGWADCITSKSVSISQHKLLTPADPTRPQDGPRWVESISFPELDDEGEISMVQGWLVDITHRKLSERLMEQRLKDALENKRASENFIDMVSHEIRNPLSAVLQLSDGILTTISSTESPSTKDLEAVIDSAQTIALCTHHQKKIVDDVLVISKLDSNLLVMSPDQCYAPRLMERAIKMHGAELSRADIEASCRVDESFMRLVGSGCVLLDESRVLQIVLNLLGNAIKFTRESETRHITVELSASIDVPQNPYGAQFAPVRPKAAPDPVDSISPLPQTDVYIQFAVMDTGRGLSQEEIDKLFQRFSQASPKTYKQYGGSGLGLFISKELCELQGGQIGVMSQGPGQGSKFTFYVKASYPEPNDGSVKEETPLPESVATASLERDVATVEVTAAEEKGRAPDSHDLHVLIVEDNAINQKVMAQQLRRLGCTVHVADHGVECLAFLSKSSLSQSAGEQVSVVLMDVEMPIMDGLTCTRRIRELEKTGEIIKHVPIIAITANARNEHVVAALDAGVDEVVTKPFRIPSLLPQMQSLVGRFAGPKD